jgi:hypothetical protein
MTLTPSQLTLNLLTTTIVAHPSNASKWQMRFNSAFKGLKSKEVNNSCRGLDRPCGFQQVEAPRFQDIRHIKMVRLSALRTGRFTNYEIFLLFISVRRWIDHRTIVRPERLRQWKIPNIEPATFRLVQQCLNQCPTTYPSWLKTVLNFRT